MAAAWTDSGAVLVGGGAVLLCDLCPCPETGGGVVVTPCCPDKPIPKTLHLTVTSELFGGTPDCPCLDGVTIRLDWQDPATSGFGFDFWFGTAPHCVVPESVKWTAAVYCAGPDVGWVLVINNSYPPPGVPSPNPEEDCSANSLSTSHSCSPVHLRWEHFKVFDSPGCLAPCWSDPGVYPATPGLANNLFITVDVTE